MKYICDCGQVYSERAAVQKCQDANHSAAVGCELADAVRFAQDMGVDLHALTPNEIEVDDCSRCHGSRGGVKGNENIVNGVLLCDYCCADDLTTHSSSP